MRHRLRRLVFLHADPACIVAVDVHGERVLGHVRVVDSKARHVCALCPLREVRVVLLQTVREHRGARAFAGRLESRATRVLRIGLDGVRVQVESQQPAFQRTVEQRVRAIRPQPHFPAERRIAGEHRRFPVREARQQPGAQGRVQRRQRLLVAESDAVGRVDQHEARLERRFLEIGDVAALERQVIAEPGAVRIGDRRAHGTLVTIVAAEATRAETLEIAGGLRRIADAAPRECIMAAPALEPETAAQQPGRHARGDQRGLDHERAGAAHRIDERSATLGDFRPTGAQQQRRGQIFLERRFDARLAVPAAMQRLAREVDADHRAFACKADVDAQVRALQVHRRPRPGALAEAIDDRVLHLQRRELRVSQPGRALADGIDGQRALRLEMVFPGHLHQRGVERLRCIGGHLAERQDHAARGARMQAGEVAVLERPLESDAGGMLASRLDAERAQLGGQQVRDIARAGGEELEDGRRYRLVQCVIPGRRA